MKNLLKGIITICLSLISIVTINAQKKKSMENTALLIIDVQNDYFKGGRMTLVGAEEAGKNVQQVLAYFRKNNLPVVHIKHIATNDGATFFLPDTEGVEISPLVTPNADEKVVIKHYPNSFRETELLEYLHSKGIKNLVITGMMTDVCVESTTRAAFDYGFSNTIVGDATATRDRELDGQVVKAADVQKSFLAGISALGGLYTGIVNTQDLLKGK
ncbi:cysteine hydrolase family protein [Elizabethkingia sp. HX WHF]|uniref:Cysteine hydrolase n=1 Tax=Elizabethkingia bruuniana TaxID=1756149 RepID=A0A7T7UX44_9FLAO|nr:MULTISPECIES: cysteine hydrolase family protein [Elizabethkingia]RBI91500.1 cysteine hydrolase [Elizabethkingia miricola]MCL1638572.1 cysteine hydrolase [Elizabethkingia bruuniana]MDX8564397.1 cysteine hydrolase family protein [Elizabethkingia sp. HX WHF]QDZ63142.1 cysteine hydrolase [Elizabethkingia bruuniana]QQN57644.1 cysteine hydrolase [Elizabethkingia bruuniana]